MSAAMDDMRHEKPAEYVRVMFSILPKELTVERAVEGLEDEELELLLAEMRERRAKLIEQPKEVPPGPERSL